MTLEHLLTSRRASMCAWIALGALCLVSFILAGCAAKTADPDSNAAATIRRS